MMMKNTTIMIDYTHHQTLTFYLRCLNLMARLANDSAQLQYKYRYFKIYNRIDYQIQRINYLQMFQSGSQPINQLNQVIKFLSITSTNVESTYNNNNMDSFRNNHRNINSLKSYDNNQEYKMQMSNAIYQPIHSFSREFCKQKHKKTIQSQANNFALNFPSYLDPSYSNYNNQFNKLGFTDDKVTKDDTQVLYKNMNEELESMHKYNRDRFIRSRKCLKSINDKKLQRIALCIFCNSYNRQPNRYIQFCNQIMIKKVKSGSMQIPCDYHQIIIQDLFCTQGYQFWYVFDASRRCFTCCFKKIKEEYMRNGVGKSIIQRQIRRSYYQKQAINKLNCIKAYKNIRKIYQKNEVDCVQRHKKECKSRQKGQKHHKLNKKKKRTNSKKQQIQNQIQFITSMLKEMKIETEGQTIQLRLIQQPIQ